MFTKMDYTNLVLKILSEIDALDYCKHSANLVVDEMLKDIELFIYASRDRSNLGCIGMVYSFYIVGSRLMEVKVKVLENSGPSCDDCSSQRFHMNHGGGM
jgi:hypothetical protein